MKISGVDIRPGNIIEYEGGIWRAVKIQHTQPGKGGAYMQVEMKNLIDGRKTNVRFRSAETVERVRLDTKDFQFLFADGDTLTFMDKETYEQTTLPRDLLGDAAAFLQDGMDVSWSAAYIRRLLAQYVEDRAVDVVITFDERGVSLHPNHRAVYDGARLWAETHPQRLWTLDTLTWRTKFAGPVSAVLQRWSASDWVVLASWRAYATSLAAMWQHRTQLVWFRYLYMACSSYMQANRLTMVQGG